MPGQRGRGLPICTATSKRTGLPCRNRAVSGATVCRMHGGGTRVRVEQGTRKMPGRPVDHGRYANADRIRWDELGKRQRAILASDELRQADKELALVKAAFEMATKAIEDGTFDESSSPATWLLHHGCRLIEIVERVSRIKSKYEQFAMSEQAVAAVFRRVLEKYIPEERHHEAHQEIEAGLADAMEAA